MNHCVHLYYIAALTSWQDSKIYHCLGEESSLTHIPNIIHLHRIGVSQHAVNEAQPVNAEERHRIQ